MNEYYVERENVRIAAAGIEVFPQHYHSIEGNVSAHIHTAVELLYIINGSFRLFADDVEHIAREGDLVLFRSNTIHRVYCHGDTPGSYEVIKITPDFILELCSRDHGPAYLLSLALQNKDAKTVWTKAECETTGITAALQRLISEYRNGGYGSDIAVKICAAEIVLILLRTTEPRRDPELAEITENENMARRIYNAIVYINKHYAEEITALECSHHVFMSYSYFSRSFKKITGRTFKDYLVLTRINHAEKALLSTEKCITDIAADCGFNNVSYFISTYKKIKGITPAAFRTMIKK